MADANMSEPTVLVTGATGYLGRHLSRALHATGVASAVLVRKASSWEAQAWRREAGDVSVIEGHPLDLDRWRKHHALGKVRTIFHTAGMVSHSRTAPEEMLKFNVEGTLGMVHLAKQLGARLVFVSSSGTVGCFRYKDMSADEDSPYAEPTVSGWPYYVSKIRAERDARRLADHLGVELVIVRPPVLLGPDDHRHRSTAYVRKVLDNKIPAVPRGGMNFTDVRDVSTALARIVELERPRRVYHMPGHNLSLREFFDAVIEVSGAKPIRRPMPPWAALGLAKVAGLSDRRPSWIPDPVVLEMSNYYWGINSLHAHELGYTPRSARQTLSDTVTWLRSGHATPPHHAAAKAAPTKPLQPSPDL